jgi:hypothetical protein
MRDGERETGENRDHDLIQDLKGTLAPDYEAGAGTRPEA